VGFWLRGGKNEPKKEKMGLIFEISETVQNVTNIVFSDFTMWEMVI
jgi:hypothetical protein